jgi:hypothetical protein
MGVVGRAQVLVEAGKAVNGQQPNDGQVEGYETHAHDDRELDYCNA